MQVNSYRPIDLLPILTKVFEKMLLLKISPHLVENEVMPQYQFRFQEKHGIIEQVHRIVSEIRSAPEDRKYCSTVFLGVVKVFAKVWDEGLIFQIKKLQLPVSWNFGNFSFDRKFRVKYVSLVHHLSWSPSSSFLGPYLQVYLGSLN